ncbi:hypothetical protein LTR56_006105 [Elasticomyces elasticus]|nr:hypothetical protein LTR56_006105 [Elasticomyces elasticus]KAK3667633.1 hypothetical protein LTR22_001448 [Elasticomyces elasticus]KAK4928411.1 hypothetical protein LTR49_004818 [Elasticomyces elasticus]KAK5767212.1 hypothetical protein LTS12_002670 [Elasticomyces elasticus]
MDSSREPSPFDARAYNNNPDWVALALEQEPELAAVTQQLGAMAGGLVRPFAKKSPGKNTVATSLGFIVCHNLDSIPSGRQTSKKLKCGVAGCTLTTLFDRKFELERHMRTHFVGDFPCAFHGCERNVKPFTRPDKLGEHLKKVHGQT